MTWIKQKYETSKPVSSLRPIGHCLYELVSKPTLVGYDDALAFCVNPWQEQANSGTNKQTNGDEEMIRLSFDRLLTRLVAFHDLFSVRHRSVRRTLDSHHDFFHSKRTTDFKSVGRFIQI